MAAIYLETPARVLARLERFEDVELPSLPSFQHIDYDSESGAETSSQGSNRSAVFESEIDPATPHPLRRQIPSTTGLTFTQTTSQSPAETSSTSSASPFPPIDGTPINPSATNVALTSTPHSHSRSRSRGLTNSLPGPDSRRISTASDLKSSSSTRREIWSTPGQLSTSFEGEEIPPSSAGQEDLGAEISVPLNDASMKSFDQSLPSETPVTRRLSQGHVLLQRPGRRGTSTGIQQLQALQHVQEELDKFPATAVHVPEQDRIPSLSRSEVSVTDTSGGASTPEGPMRVLAVNTSLSGMQSTVFYDSAEPRSFNGDPTAEYGNESGSANDNSGRGMNASRRLDINTSETPGIARSRVTSYDSHSISINRPTALTDITASAQNIPLPFTPSPAGYSKTADFSTPRPALDDAERRKNHVLAVLSSTGLPSRIMRSVRGTPHPLRRVSMAPHSESIAEEGSPMTAFQNNRSLMDQSENESFVSIASSADLTSDRRASHIPHLTRGNTSFPNILLPTGGSAPSPGGSLRGGLSDKRVDGAKLHKHLNAMNQQLLQENGELAREAGAWRDEVDRLRAMLSDAGIEVEDMAPVVGHVSFTDLPQRMRRRQTEIAHSPRNSTSSPRKDDSVWQAKLDRQFEKSDLLISQLSQLGRGTSEGQSVSAQDILNHMSPEEHAAVMQEMAERLEALEEGLEDKDRMIEDLEAQLNQKTDPTGNDDLRQHIEALTRQVEEAEKARTDLHAEFALKTEKHAQQFGEICSGFEEQVKTLERDLGVAQSEIERVKSEKVRLENLASSGSLAEREVEWKKQISDLEDELRQAREDARQRKEELEANVRKVQDSAQAITEAEKRAKNAEDQVGEMEARLKAARNSEKDTGLELKELQARLETAEADRHTAEDDVQRLTDQIADLQQSGTEQEAELDRQHEEIQQLLEKVHELESELSSNRENDADELHNLQQELQEVREALAEREEDLEELRGKLERSVREDEDRQDDSFVKDLEERLDEAHREIGRLKHDLSATPHRKTAIEVKDARIRALEREKAALADRLANVKLPEVKEAGSPFSRATPFVHRAIASLKTPKTPGPMKDLSWLQTTIGDANEPILAAQIQYLQTELQNANSQLDTNFDRLESAGQGAVALAEKLAETQDRIVQLEGELAALKTGSKRAHSAERETTANLSRALQAVHEQMAHLKSDMATERERLQRENGRLNDLISELRLKSQKETEIFRSEIDRVSEEVQEEVNELKQHIKAVKEERDSLKTDLHALTVKNRKLERELVERQNAFDELSSRHARQQRNQTSQVENLEKAEITRLKDTLREEQSKAEQLRDDLCDRVRALELAEGKVVALEAKCKSVTTELQGFERDLEIQRRESRRFGAELQGLKRNQETVKAEHAMDLAKVEREVQTVRAKLQETRRELDIAQSKYSDLRQWKISHECDTGKQLALDTQKERFKAQSRELAGQVRYLKAKYTREATFRNALSLQKRYLLILIGSMSLNEQASLKIIATMGFPMPAPSPPRRSLKTVAIALIAVIRARKQAKQWRTELIAKPAKIGDKRIRN